MQLFSSWIGLKPPTRGPLYVLYCAWCAIPSLLFRWGPCLQRILRSRCSVWTWKSSPFVLYKPDSQRVVVWLHLCITAGFRESFWKQRKKWNSFLVGLLSFWVTRSSRTVHWFLGGPYVHTWFSCWLRRCRAIHPTWTRFPPGRLFVRAHSFESRTTHFLLRVSLQCPVSRLRSNESIPSKELQRSLRVCPWRTPWMRYPRQNCSSGPSKKAHHTSKKPYRVDTRFLSSNFECRIWRYCVWGP